MTTITPEQRKAIEEAGSQPAQVLDPTTNTTYLLLKVEDYTRLVAAGFAPPPADPTAMYPLIDEAFGRAGWDDPKMAEYDDYESHRP